MANFGYGSDTYTTSYGAQGGADGGGFMGGSQAGSQESPSGNKTYGKESLRAVTIKQIIDAQQPHPDADHKIDGTEVSLVTFIGQTMSVAQQNTNTTYRLDDGTGIVDVKQWVDADAVETQTAVAKEGDYLQVWGKIKAFNGKKFVGAHMIRPVTDYNEIQYHFLEATAVHLYFTRGLPGEAGGGVGVKGEAGTDMFVDSMGGGAAVGGALGKKIPSKLSAASRKVFELLQSAPQNNEGLHVQQISGQTGLQVNDVFKAGDELLSEGMIYTTVDDETWAVLEY